MRTFKTVIRSAVLIVLAAILAASLCACSTSGTGQITDTDFGGYEFILASHWGSDYSFQPGQSTLGDAMIAKYAEIEQTYNCTITLKHYADIDTLVDSVSKEVLAGDKPFDILDLPYKRFQQLLNRDVLYQQDKIQAIDFSSPNFDSTAQRAGTYLGKVYASYFGPPKSISGVFYNKTMLNQQNQPDPLDLYKQDDWTWDRFEEICKAVTKDTDNDGTADVYGIVGNWMLERQAIWSNGGSILKQDGDTFVFNLTSQNSLDAVNFVRKLAIQDGVISSEYDWKQIVDVFSQGQAAFLPYYFWGAREMIGDAMKNADFGFVPFPKGPAATGYSSVAMETRVFVMPKTLTNPEVTGTIYNELATLAPAREADMKQLYMDKGVDEDSYAVYQELAAISDPDFSEGVPNISAAILMLDPYGTNVARDATQDPAASFSSVASMVNKAADNFFSKINGFK